MYTFNEISTKSHMLVALDELIPKFTYKYKEQIASLFFFLKNKAGGLVLLDIEA